MGDNSCDLDDHCDQQLYVGIDLRHFYRCACGDLLLHNDCCLGHDFGRVSDEAAGGVQLLHRRHFRDVEGTCHCVLVLHSLLPLAAKLIARVPL